MNTTLLHSTTAHRLESRQGFSLIEVLIAIVVLALGLLGLAAVFPVVVGQQRRAADLVQGISVDRSIEAYIVNHGMLSSPPVNGQVGSVSLLATATNRRGWHVLSADQDWSPRGDWVLTTASNAANGGIAIDPTTGNMVLGNGSVTGTGNGQGFIKLPVTERLMPRPFSSDQQPQFVWDMVARRIIPAGEAIPAGLTQSELAVYRARQPIQIAVFTRRLDTGIRVGPGQTLSDVLTGPSPALPLGIDAGGVPTLNGTGNYSAISQFAYKAFVNPTPPPGASPGDYITIDTANSDASVTNVLSNITQLGQRFVDDSGVVHTVTQVFEAGATTVLKIDPPVSGEVLSRPVTTMLFTPQVPASVNVFTIKPFEASARTQ